MKKKVLLEDVDQVDQPTTDEEDLDDQELRTSTIGRRRPIPPVLRELHVACCLRPKHLVLLMYWFLRPIPPVLRACTKNQFFLLKNKRENIYISFRGERLLRQSVIVEINATTSPTKSSPSKSKRASCMVNDISLLALLVQKYLLY